LAGFAPLNERGEIMPNCFSLTRKGEKEPEKLTVIDERLWRELGKQEPDPEKWYFNWYNHIGLLLALGQGFMNISEKFEKLVMDCLDEEKKEEAEFYNQLFYITEFLSENYTSSAWYSHK
jgi:hypothetical protein